MSAECDTRAAAGFALPISLRNAGARIGAWPAWAPIGMAVRIFLLSLVVPGAFVGAAAFLTDPAQGSLARWLDTRVATVALQPDARYVAPLGGMESLTRIFEDRSFRLDSVREGWAPVPRIFLRALPSDMEAAEVGEARKMLFMQAALPLVLLVNESILAERERLRGLLDKERAGIPLDEHELHWLKALARHYRAKSADLKELLRRVDIVPPSLALAQGAAESGWGTSRPALEDNALFGQMTWIKGTILPDGTHAEPTFVVRPFEDLYECVRAYARNLNSHAAYAEFRERRAEMRMLGRNPDGYRLAITLDRYSERGWAYLAEVRLIIRANQLSQLDGAWLDGRSGALLLVPGA